MKGKIKPKNEPKNYSKFKMNIASINTYTNISYNISPPLKRAITKNKFGEKKRNLDFIINLNKKNVLTKNKT